MDRLKKFLFRRPVLFLTLFYFLFRLPFFTRLPIFIDEATYLDWGWRTIHIPGLFFFPLVWSKMPLSMWLFGIFQSVFTDPLLAGRLVSTFTGWLTLLGLFLLTRHVFNLKTAFTSGFLYIIIPVFAFYDRQALMESALGSAGIWACYFLTRLVEKPHLKWSALLGFSLGLAFLIKANGLVFVPATALILLYYVWKSPAKRFSLAIQSVYILGSFILTSSVVLMQDIYWKYAGDITFFTLTPAELIRFPVSTWLTNLWFNLSMAFWYLTPLIFIAVFLGRKKVGIPAFWPVLTILIATLLVRHTETRYLAPYLAPLLLFAADWLSPRLKLLSVFIIPALAITTLLIISPPDYFKFLSRFTRFSQITEYLSGRNTGYQVQATLEYLKSHLPQTPVYVAVAANAGNPEQAILTYMRHRPDTYIGYLHDNIFGDILKSVSCFSASVPVFFVARHDEQVGLNQYFMPVVKIANKYNSDYETIYTLKTPCTGKTLNLDNLISYYSRVL